MSNIFNTYSNIVKSAGILSALGSGLYNTGSAINSVSNPVGKYDDTLGYSLGKGITEWVLPREYNPDNNGRYADLVDYLKQTEEGDQLLREAAKLRRRARIMLRQAAEEEEAKRHAASSRYF